VNFPNVFNFPPRLKFSYIYRSRRVTS